MLLFNKMKINCSLFLMFLHLVSTLEHNNFIFGMFKCGFVFFFFERVEYFVIHYMYFVRNQEL